MPIAGLALLPPLAAGLVQWFWMPVHLLFFFVAAMACHGELSRRRPPPAGLTGFYLAIAVGGVLGSLFNAILAPIAFDRMAEYPIAVVLACLVPTLWVESGERPWRSLATAGTVLGLSALLAADPGGVSGSAFGTLCVCAASGIFVYVIGSLKGRPLTFALTFGAILLGTGLAPGVGGRILRRERNFYGILRVTEDDAARARASSTAGRSTASSRPSPAASASRRPITCPAARPRRSSGRWTRTPTAGRPASRSSGSA